MVAGYGPRTPLSFIIIWKRVWELHNAMNKNRKTSSGLQNLVTLWIDAYNNVAYIWQNLEVFTPILR